PFGLATSALDLSWTTFGLGKHMSQVSPSDLSKGLLFLWLQLWLYHIAIWLSKLSALAFYARIFGLDIRRFRFTIWLVTGLVCTWIMAIFITLLLQCRPLQKAWEPTMDGICMNTYIWWLAASTSSFILDLIILILPLPMLWRLHVKTYRKFLMFCVFLCGYSVVIVSLGRVIQQAQANPGNAPFLPDVTYDIIPGGKWLAVESPIAIFSLCLPSIFALVKRGISGGPRALFPSRRAFDLASNTDRTGMLHASATDVGTFHSMYNVPRGRTSREDGIATNYHAMAVGEVAADGSLKARPASLRDSVIHVRTDISIVTQPAWVDLTGVNI
ncbi:hypothetical protein MMC18_009629, partial [Xylographa bjoerkii]|nr:hypothetical protein [Xylographa bjoerkii]